MRYHVISIGALLGPFFLKIILSFYTPCAQVQRDHWNRPKNRILDRWSKPCNAKRVAEIEIACNNAIYPPY